MKSNQTDDSARDTQHVFLRQYSVCDVKGLIPGQILRKNSPAPERSIRDERKRLKLSEDTERARSIEDRKDYFARRHEPGFIDLRTLLRCNGDGSVGKSRRKNERLLSLRLDFGQRQAACYCSGRSLP